MRQAKVLSMTILLVVVFCQLAAQGNTIIGVKGGLNISNLAVSGDTSWDPEYLDYKTKLDFAAGGFLEFKVSPKISLQPELLYSRKGAKHEFHAQETINGTDIYNGTNKATWTMSYLQVPILGKYNVSDRIGIFVGPSLSFLLSSKEKWEFNGSYLGQNYTADGDDDMKKFTNDTDFSFIIGGEYSVNKLLLDLRYDMGLSKLEKEAGDNSFKNRTFSVLIGYKL